MENQNFNTEKNTWTYIILQMCTINDSHMIYGSWDMECNGQNFLSLWTIFCTFTPLTTQKIKIYKKNAWRYYHFTHMYHKWQSYDVWLLRYWVWQRIFCHFEPFFALSPSEQPKKSKFWKNEKTPGVIIILQKCTKNHDHML